MLLHSRWNTCTEAIETFFVCQSGGLESGNDCGDTPQIHLAVFGSLSALAIILVGLLPSVVIAFTVKCERQREKHKDIIKPHSHN